MINKKNPETMKKVLEKNKLWIKNHKEEYKEYQKNYQRVAYRKKNNLSEDKWRKP
jgi:hypothetical protein